MSDSSRIPYRIQWVDYLKGFCITYVVLAHVYDGLRWKSDAFREGYSDYFHIWVSGYSMAFFFFVSGMFTQSAFRKPFLGFLENRVRTGVYPYVLWVVLFTAMSVALNTITNTNMTWDPIRYMWVDPPFQYWYVYSLVLISLLWLGLRKLGVEGGVLVLLFLILYAFQDTTRNPYWPGAHFVASQGIFFALGAWFGPKGAVADFSRAPAKKLFAVIAVAVGVLYLGTISGMKAHDLSMLPLVLTALTGMIALATLLQRYRRLRIIEFIGKRSLAIYLVHVFFTAAARILLQKVLGIESIPVHLAVGIIAGILGPLVLWEASIRFNFPYLFSLSPLRVKPVKTGPMVPVHVSVAQSTPAPGAARASAVLRQD